MLYECCSGYLIESWYHVSDFIRSCRVRASNAMFVVIFVVITQCESFGVNRRTVTSIINLRCTESISTHNCFIEETKLSSKLYFFCSILRINSRGEPKLLSVLKGANHPCFPDWGREHSVFLLLRDERFVRSNNNCFFLNKVARKSVDDFLLVITRYRRYDGRS